MIPPNIIISIEQSISYIISSCIQATGFGMESHFLLPFLVSTQEYNTPYTLSLPFMVSTQEYNTPRFFKTQC